MKSRDFEVTKKGWPDFICFKDGVMVCVEVKPNAAHPLRKSQVRIMQTLTDHGITCYRWDIEAGLRTLEGDVVSL